MIRIALLTATASLLLGGTKERIRYEIDEVFFSRCSLEEIHLTGRGLLIITTKVEGSKTTVEVQDVETAMRGVGLATGREYIFNLSGHFKDTFDSEPPFTFTSKANSRQITVVKGEGQFTHIQGVYTMTFDGTNTVINERRFVDECPGAGT
jgi:hypothetical protein